MNTATSAQIAEYMRGKENVLILAGYQCDEMELGGRKLGDYAAELAVKLDAPVAATGNSVVALRDKGARARKQVALEVLELLRYEKWRGPIADKRPDLLVFIGYPRGMAQGLVSAARDVETVVLGTAAIEGATRCLPDASLKNYQKSLDQLIQSLAKQAG